MTYREHVTSSLTDDGKLYGVNDLLAATEGQAPIQVPTDELRWVLAHTTVDPARVAAADLTAPLLVAYRGGELYVLDGAHRLQRAVNDGVATLPVRLVSQTTLLQSRFPRALNTATALPEASVHDDLKTLIQDLIAKNEPQAKVTVSGYLLAAAQRVRQELSDQRTQQGSPNDNRS